MRVEMYFTEDKQYVFKTEVGWSIHDPYLKIAFRPIEGPVNPYWKVCEFECEHPNLQIKYGSNS